MTTAILVKAIWAILILGCIVRWLRAEAQLSRAQLELKCIRWIEAEKKRKKDELAESMRKAYGKQKPKTSTIKNNATH